MTRPKIGLALGSGGARGFSHLGVIKTLADYNVPIDYIAGSSMGALIGALYAAGQRADDLYKLALTFRRKYFTDVSVPRMGLLQGERIRSYIRLFTYEKNIEQFAIPMSIVTTDLYTGNKVVFREGDAASAVRASISIPGVFVPEKINDQLLVDGGVIDRVPISVVREMGADIVIAVDCSNFEANEEIHSIYDVIMQSIDIMQDDITDHMLMDADIVMRPEVYQFSSRNYSNTADIIQKGEEEAEQQIAEIRALMKGWNQ